MQIPGIPYTHGGLTVEYMHRPYTLGIMLCVSSGHQLEVNLSEWTGQRFS